MSNIKRMMLSILLDITKEDFEKITTNDLDYVHVLSMSTKGKELLSLISKKSNIKVITSINDKVLNNLSDIDKLSLNKDIYASNIYSIISNDKINKDYTNKL